MATTVRNPIEWSWAQLRSAGEALGGASQAVRHMQERMHGPVPAVRRIRVSELREVLAAGLRDFGAFRSDVAVICIIYPLAGLILAHAAFGQDLIPLLFPLAAGFALLGPFAALGLYEMSRQREQRADVGWRSAFAVLRSPAIGSIVLLGLALAVLFLLWLAAAWAIFAATLGPEPPSSLAGFVEDVFGTAAGWTMIVAGCLVGFLFALGALAISLVSFPLLLDRDAGIDVAVRTSLRAMRVNPGPVALWGLIVATGLVLGAIPLLLGLIVVMPVLGHATWHLYRRLVLR